MAQVYRRRDTKYWFAGWYDAQGRFHLRSTKQTDRKKALAIALEYERAERMARQGMASEAQYRKVLNDMLARSGSPDRLRDTTVREWLNDWISKKEVRRKQDTADRYRGVVNAFLESLGQVADRPLAALHVRQVEDYVTKCQTTTSGGNAKLHLATLRTALTAARRQGLIDANPAEAVEMPESDGEGHEPFTPAEVAMLRKAAKGEWGTLILLAYYTGARLTALATLRWEQVDLTQGQIVFPKPQKHGRPVIIPMHPELLSEIETLASKDRPEEFVLPTLSEADSGGKRGLSLQFKQIVKDAAVDLREITRPNKRKHCKRSFHSLRHSFTSVLANAGVEPEVRRKLTGHKSAAVHDIYTHFQPEVLKAAIQKAPSLPKL